MHRLSLSLTCLVLAACGASGSGAIPADTVMVVAEGQNPVTYSEAVAGSVGLSTSEQPAEFEQIQTSASCRTPRPGSGAKVAYVYTYGGGVPSPMQYVNFVDSPEAAAARSQAIDKVRAVPTDGFEESAVKKEAMAFSAGNAVEWARRIDVVVTETQSPVFLYLTSYDPVLWNIQRAPGVQIDGIVVHAYEGGVIANGVDASRTGFIAQDGSPNAKCYVSGRGRAIPVAERIASATKLNENFDPKGYKEEWEKDYRANQRYFQSELPKLIGARPHWLLNDARGGSFNAILIGPQPPAPIDPQPVARLQVPSHVTPYWGTRDGAMKAFGLDGAT